MDEGQQLKLNNIKTYVIMFGSNLNLDKLSSINIKVGDEQKHQLPMKFGFHNVK
jgi:hypothetical protein